jgi:cell wall-associated NlpC family hydrolase
MTDVHRALVLARGLRPAVRGLSRIRTADGERIRVPRTFATTVLGMRMELRYPSSDEDHDVHPWTPMPRSQVAYSLWIAATEVDAGFASYLNQQYDEVVLPRMGDGRQAIVEWGASYAGFPYVWGGEWGLRSRSPLGGQSIPGFDCSGLVWWLMRRNDGGAWNVAPPRPYRGWSLPERSSAQMAGGTDERLRWNELRPGDLALYDGSGDGVVDHVDVYVGNGWALDSSTSQGGVTLMWVGEGSWYRQNFVYGRRIT